MNYRHQFHAGNFADVMKHALLVGLTRALQKKEKGFVTIDTHAGRGGYDLAAAARGDSLERRPEWPEGIGRLWGRAAAGMPPLVAEYVALAREFDRCAGNLGEEPRFYPGSPALARSLARPVDRLVFCERHPEECTALRRECAGAPRTAVREEDGYAALRGLLPPLERRALTLIDPPFEAQDEFARIAKALEEGLGRLRGGVFAVWYPLTQRARVEEFFAAVRTARPPSALAAELEIAGEDSGLKLRGCGVMVINPPWRFEEEARVTLEYLAEALAQGPGAAARIEWVAREGASGG